MPDFGIDRSVRESASWRLASELVRRHPSRLRIRHTRPGGGQYDCLTICPLTGTRGRIDLNREGRIHLLKRFDGREAPIWEPVKWDVYLQADPRSFLDWMERQSGLPTPPHVPSATSRTLTYRVLAAVAATAFKSVHPIRIEPGWIDTSMWACHPNPSLDLFVNIPEEVIRPEGDEPKGYRFWIVCRDDVPILALEEEECAFWTAHHDDTFDLNACFETAKRNAIMTAAEMLAVADEAWPATES